MCLKEKDCNGEWFKSTQYEGWLRSQLGVWGRALNIQRTIIWERSWIYSTCFQRTRLTTNICECYLDTDLDEYKVHFLQLESYLKTKVAVC